MRGTCKLILILFFLFSLQKGASQACTLVGQTPGTAFPVCEKSNLNQYMVPLCGGTSIPAPCATGSNGYTDKNPFWYRFTCYSAGKLGLQITPHNTVDEDYDWQLFDITGKDPSVVYTDKSTIVAANWSGSYGVTGTSAAGRSAFECASDPNAGISTFSTMPDLIVGHNYLLLVSHFTDNQSGYILSFQGGNAIISDPIEPKMTSAYGICDGTQIVIKLNKKVNCTTVASDGSDFIVTGPTSVSVVSASGNGCSGDFDTESVTLKLSGTLGFGTYKVISKVGHDGNTLLDMCGNNMASDITIDAASPGAGPALMDSIKPVVCSTDTLQLVFQSPVLCSSIAADGSDFVITGPVPVTVKSASGICQDDNTTLIRIYLTAPIKQNGTYQVQLVNGSDNNTLINQCGKITPAGSTVSFTSKDMVAADFQYGITTGCTYDTLQLTHNGNNNTSRWNWVIDDGRTSTLQNPILYYSNGFGNKQVSLSVSNGICGDVATVKLVLPDHTVRAGFLAKDSLCPIDSLQFIDTTKSITPVLTWQWNFGNGAVSTLHAPLAQLYPAGARQTSYTARLIASNQYCTDTAYKNITVLTSCYVAVPSAFTPNGDGLNDYLYPLNTFKASALVFRVYNRYGQLLFETRDPSKKWDGRTNGYLQPNGTYVWTLAYSDQDGKRLSFKGTTVLIR